MPIGLGAATLGSAIIGAGSSILGARSANRAAQNNAAAAQQNINAANTAIGQSLDPAFGAWKGGADIANQYLTSGYGKVGGLYQPLMDQYGSGIGQMYAAKNPNVNPNLSYAGIKNFGPVSQFNPSNFQASPDYNFRKNEGLGAVQNSAAAQGGLYSGNTLRDITDYASNLASGEYGNWFNREKDKYGINYDARMGAAQFDSNQAMRKYGIQAENYGRDYGAQQDARNFNYGRGQDLTGIGVNAIGAMGDLTGGYYGNLANLYGGLYQQRGNSLIDAGRAYSNNYSGNAQIQANTPYVNPYEGVNNALQGGLQNYMWGQAAGLYGNNGGSQTPTKPMYDFQGRPIMYGTGGQLGYGTNGLYG